MSAQKFIDKSHEKAYIQFVTTRKAHAMVNEAQYQVLENKGGVNVAQVAANLFAQGETIRVTMTLRMKRNVVMAECRREYKFLKKNPVPLRTRIRNDMTIPTQFKIDSCHHKTLYERKLPKPAK